MDTVLTYPASAPHSQALHERAKASMPGGNTRTTVFVKPFPIYAARGEGCRVYDVDDVARIDCINNFTSLIHGYCHPALTKAAIRQLALGTAFGMPTESEIDLAEVLTGRVASVEEIRFSNSGTEAVMTAIKAARAFTGRSKIAKIEGAYHGTYDYAEVSLESKPESWGQGPPRSIGYAKGTPQSAIDEVIVLPFNDIDGAVSILRAHGPELAAVLVDPMPNRVGLVPGDRTYLQALREVATEIGALLIFDEVITFRLGYHGAQGIWGIDADLTAFAKIIGGGFPVGATGGRREVMAVFDPSAGKPAVSHGGTFSANPMAMSTGVATMDLLDHDAFRHLAELGDAARMGIDEAFHAAGLPGFTTGMGSLLRVHFADRPIRDYRTAYSTEAEAKRLAAFFKAMLDEGVLVAPTGLMALSTPMTMSDIDEVVAATGRALATVKAM